MRATAEFIPIQPGPPLPRVIGANVSVPLADGSWVPYGNFDYAASAPCLERVRKALDAALPFYSSVHRGAGYASRATTRAYEQARDTVRRFVGARPSDSVVFTRNTTDAMNLLAHCLPERTTVVVFESEHHASLLPWERRHSVVRLPIPPSPAAAVDAADMALAGAPYGPRLLVVTAASNVTGEVWPISALATVARSHGARIAVDAAQLLPHRPLDMAALDLDYVAFSGHKLYAPFGAGVLAGRDDWLCTAQPYLRGGGASRMVADHAVTWAQEAEVRHEAGTPNVLGAIAIAAACHALLATGWTALQSEEERLQARLRSGLASVPGLRELSLWDAGHDRVGIMSFVLDGWEPRELARVLSDSYGIGVRDGRFCAHPLVRRLLSGAGLAPSDGSAVRASIGIGTTPELVDRLVAAVGDLAARQERVA